MSRPLRIEYPGAWYHIMNRGRNREEIFKIKEDYQLFINLLKESTRLWKVRISAYCLMENHYHIIINTPQGNLSRCMRHINGIYTQQYNRRYKKDGPLFRGRYKSILISADSYLLELLRYIHRNPLKAGKVQNINDYKWSSHMGYMSSGKEWAWIYKEFIQGMLTGQREKIYSEYEKFLLNESDCIIEKIMESKKVPALLGSEEFVEKIKRKQYKQIIQEEVPECKIFLPKKDKIVGAVCRYYNIDIEEIYKSSRGKTNESRSVAVYLMRQIRGDSLCEIGEVFNIKKYSSVSTIIGRIKSRLERDTKLRQNVKKIIEYINMSQEQT